MKTRTFLFTGVMPRVLHYPQVAVAQKATGETN